MRNDLTYIILLLDKSGSMGSVQDATIEGVNSFLRQQRQQPGEAVLHVVQFDDVLEVSHNYVNLKDAKDLDHFNYQPRGMTALLDAIAETIDNVGSQLASMQENQRPGKVLFVIQTDGNENASEKFSRFANGYKEVSAKIDHQRSVYNWDFVFLGANQDAIATASNLSIAPTKALQYNSTERGTYAMLESLTTYASAARSMTDGAAMQIVSFSQADRDANKLP